MSIEIKYPDIKVELVGNDGNAFAIVGSVNRALKESGVEKEERDKFTAEAMGGDYDNLLQTAMRWVDVC